MMMMMKVNNKSVILTQNNDTDIASVRPANMLSFMWMHAHQTNKLIALNNTRISGALLNATRSSVVSDPG